MNPRPRVLLVGPSGTVHALAPALVTAGYEPTVVGDFAGAKAYLEMRPDLLITEIKLGAYNGLHLAIRAGIQQTPAIVVGEMDQVLKADAERQRATYLAPPIDQQNLLTIVGGLLQGSRHSRRSSRKQVPPVTALVNEVPARLRDVSYEGMRIEASERDAPPQYFDIRLPQFNFSCRAQRIWTSPSGDDDTRVWCGAALSTSDGETASTWRALVDIMPGLAVIS
jgi:DNA-binding response OmpR family regulator